MLLPSKRRSWVGACILLYVLLVIRMVRVEGTRRKGQFVRFGAECDILTMRGLVFEKATVNFTHT